MTPISLTLPWPVLVNKLHRNVVIRGHARTLLSAEGRAYKERAGMALLMQIHGAHPLQGALRVDLHCYRPENRGDVDGPIKATLDACNRILWRDDSQIDELHVYRHTDPGHERVEMTVEETAPAPAPTAKRSLSREKIRQVLNIMDTSLMTEPIAFGSRNVAQAGR